MKFKKKIVSRFTHVNFVNNGKYSKKHYDDLNYYASFVIFQTYKNVVLSMGGTSKKK
jgi:hypothetical protein